MNREIVVNGQLDAHRQLDIRAETSGLVSSVVAQRGQSVNKGDLLLTLDAGQRQADLREARARVKTARSQTNAAKDLNRRGLQSQVQLEQSNATLEAALAQLNRIERDIANTSIVAPFKGIVNSAPLEIGALIERGDHIAQLIDNQRYKVRGQVSQQDIGKLKLNQTVAITLITGQKLSGKLSWISAVANNESRSFAIEAIVDPASEANAQDDSSAASASQQVLPTGISATLRIPVETIKAAFITPSVLSLGDDGELGVMVVDSDNIARFVPVELISTTLAGAWVYGIESGSRMITLGQGFVNPGELVNPQFAP